MFPAQLDKEAVSQVLGYASILCWSVPLPLPWALVPPFSPRLPRSDAQLPASRSPDALLKHRLTWLAISLLLAPGSAPSSRRSSRTVRPSRPSSSLRRRAAFEQARARAR